MTDEQTLQKLYGEMWRALLSKELETLDGLHADEFVLTHMTGLNPPKAAYLRCVRDGELNYFSARAENVFVEVHGDKGKLVGQSQVEAAVFGGRKNLWRLQLDFDTEKRGDDWILIRGVASTY